VTPSFDDLVAEGLFDPDAPDAAPLESRGARALPGFADPIEVFAG
jgi:hypothetical protein